jgi:hypothetical protein
MSLVPETLLALIEASMTVSYIPPSKQSSALNHRLLDRVSERFLGIAL